MSNVPVCSDEDIAAQSVPDSSSDDEFFDYDEYEQRERMRQNYASHAGDEILGFEYPESNSINAFVENFEEEDELSDGDEHIMETDEEVQEDIPHNDISSKSYSNVSRNLSEPVESSSFHMETYPGAGRASGKLFSAT
ncbi:hypothetical protein FRC19_009331 [Serendipita sp. 401]|nr:hypothetical protein FRC19_009331 [Serendipita sp. 401]KAG9052419.1 hypothetical protein FS842_009894 [Serendipita sp. 407]